MGSAVNSFVTIVDYSFYSKLNLQYFHQGDPSCFSPAQEKTGSDETFVHVITNAYFRTVIEHAQNQT